MGCVWQLVIKENDDDDDDDDDNNDLKTDDAYEQYHYKCLSVQYNGTQ